MDTISEQLIDAFLSALIVFITSYWNIPIPQELPPKESSTLIGQFKVISITDGDTITVENSNSKAKVRLLGINAPETGGKYRKVECYSKESKEWLSSKLLSQYVYLSEDASQDSIDAYGRYLRYVSLSHSSTTINEESVREGMSKVYVWKNKSFIYTTQFNNAQKDAQKNQRGMWDPEMCGIL